MLSIGKSVAKTLSKPPVNEILFQGVKIILSNNLKLECLIKASISKVKSKGYSLPDEIIVSHEHFKDLHKFDNAQIAGHFVLNNVGLNTLKNTIYLNPAYDWSKTNTIGSTSSQLHPIIHEIGHYAHYSEEPLSFITSRKAVPESVSSKVSEYAKTNAKEFVAEVFVRKVLDFKDDLDVDYYYRFCNGPTIGPKNKTEKKQEERWNEDFY